MTSSGLIRWGGLAAMLSGVALIVDALLDLAWPLEAWTDAAYLVAVLLSVVGLVGFHTLQKSTYGRIGRVGFWTVVVASVAQMLGLIGLHFLAARGLLTAESTALDWLAYPVGALGMLVGLVLYGAATLQAKVLPRWCGIAFIVAFPITLAMGGIYGDIWYGLVWVALGYALWSRRDTAVGQLSRVN